MTYLQKRFRDFLREEDGIVLAETLMILPMLIWVLVAMFVYWDVWRTVNTGQKAAYSIADLLSRQEDPIAPSYLANMRNILTFLMPGAPAATMRITSFEFDEDENEYCQLFSYSTDIVAAPVLTESEIQNWRATKIPTLSDRESVFVVETWVNFQPRFDTGVLNFAPGLGPMTFGEFIVTRPRERRIVLEGTAHDCL